MKRVITVIVVVAIAIASFFAFRWFGNQRTASAMDELQTVAVSRGSLTASVGATGSVRANQSTFLTWSTSGIVERIYVENGQMVEPGEMLAVLEQTSLPQSVILAEAELINAQNALEDLLTSDTAQAKAQQNLYQAQVAVIEAERAVDMYEEETYKEALDEAKDDVIEREEDLEQAVEDFEPYQDFDPENETRKSLEQDLEDARNAYDEAVRNVELLELEKEQALASLAAAEAQLEDAQRRYDRLKDGPNLDDITAQEARVAAAQATLDLAELAAPFSGTITQVDISEGDKVSPGTLAFRVDDLSRLLVDVQVSEVDINRVEVGQAVNLAFDAVLGKQYQGVVIRVSPAGNVVQGVVEFTVTVEMTDADEDVKPGMTAAVNIIVEELTNVLMVPNRAVRVRDGLRVVYIQENDELNPVNITLGSSSDTMSQVVDGGLQVGDVVVLNPPQIFDTNGPPPFVGR